MKLFSPLAVLLILSANFGSAAVSLADDGRVAQIAARLPAAPAGTGKPCADRAAWASVSPSFQGNVARAERMIAKPIPPWDDARYLEYSRTGTRVVGERMRNDHIGQLAPLVEAECAEWHGRFLPRIAEQLDAISSLRSWTLPAHDPKLENYSGTRHFVDLGAAALGHEVAETLYLLGPQLPQDVYRRAMDALERNMFAPTREAIRGGRHEFWFDGSNNWNAVCWNGIVASALAVLPDRLNRARFAAAGELHSQTYLKSFSDSGYAEEGIGYWAFGFDNYDELREELLGATGGAVDLYDRAKAREAALFAFRFAMLPGVYADFGDARFESKPDATLVTRLASVFGLDASLTQSTQAQAESPATAQLSGSLASTMLLAFPAPGRRRNDARASDPDDSTALRTYYRDPGVLVVRPATGGTLGVTIKAGGNGSHSHNDVGSFSIGAKGRQPIGDPGGPFFYTSATFGPHRFDSRLLNSFGHPVPVIDGRLQLDATKIHPSVLNTNFTPGEDDISMDLTPAYDDANLRRFVRTLHASRGAEASVTIEDHFDGAGPLDVEESLPTHGTIHQVDDHTVVFELGEARVRCRIDAPGPIDITQTPIFEFGVTFTRVGARSRLPGSGTITLHFTEEP